MATETNELGAVIQELADRAEITDLVSRLAMLADEKRFDELDTVQTEDVVGLMKDGEIRVEGLAAMREKGRAALGRFAAVQHMVTNILVDLDGDDATIRANLVATHVYDADDPSGVWTVKGVYRHKAVRTPDGWRLKQTSMQRIWEEDTSKNPAGL